MTSFPEIETPRLRLRLCEPGDLGALHAIYSDPEVMSYIGMGAKSINETEESINSSIACWLQHRLGSMAVICKQYEKLIGRAGLGLLDNTSDVQVGFVLAKDYWGQGMAAEAAHACLHYGFGELTLPKIFAAARATNAASRKLIERLGMHFDRDAHYYGHAAVIYSLNREDYRLPQEMTINITFPHELTTSSQ